MAPFLLMMMMVFSLVTAIYSARSLVIEWRKSQRQLYGTMNFEVRISRSAKMQMITHTVLCLVSLSLLAASFVIFEFVQSPML